MNPSTRPVAELRNKLLWVVILRVIVLVPVLGLAAILRTQLSVESLWVFWLALYALSLIHFLLNRLLLKPLPGFYLQMLTDLTFVTLLVYQSEDFNSIFIPLYLLVIIYASILDQRRGGIWATTLSILCYVGIVGLSFHGWIPFQTAVQPFQEVAPRIVLNLMSFVGVGYLGVSLSKRLQLIKMELGKTEDSLAELQALHKNIVDSIRSGLFTTDLQGSITSFNPAAEEITHHTEQHVAGKPCSLVMGESGLRRLLRTDFTRLRRALRSELWVPDALGRWRYMGFSASPLLSQSDKVIGFTISFQDLTEIKRLEEEVRLKEKMAAIGNLVAGIAHELRNPLGSIAGSVQVLKSDLDLTGDRERLLNVVLQESDRLNKIVEDLLCYAKPRDLILRPVALDRLLDETLQLARNDARFAAHRIQVDKPAEVPACVASPDQIKQVFWNLISNAAKAMPKGGSLMIRISHTPHYLKIAFKDHGVGMTRQQRERLFQPFASGFSDGVGLGMAIVYQIIQRHRGKIAVRSRKNRGTTVILGLPLAAQASESPESQSDAVASGK